MNLTDLSQILDQYVSRFQEMDDLLKGDESAKWRIADRFASTWKQSLPFAEKFTAAVQGADTLLDPDGKRSLEGIKFYLRYPEGVVFAEQCFSWLFQEDNGDIAARQERIKAVSMQLQGEIEHKKRTYRAFPFDEELALRFLNLARPSENYFYRKDEANFFASCVGYPADFSGNLDLPAYYAMCDEVLAVVSEREDLQNLLNLRLAKNSIAEFPDAGHLLVYDIIHCNYVYGLMPGRTPGKISKSENAKRIQESEQREELNRRLMMLQVKLKHLEQVEEVNPLAEGTTVSHKTYGAGVISECTSTGVAVRFSDDTRKFRFPDAFDRGFLTLTDTGAMDDCQRAIAQRAERTAAENEIRKIERKLKSMSA